MMHHMAEIGMTLRSVEILVFDEADRLFEMGFSAQISEIMKSMSEKRYPTLQITSYRRNSNVCAGKRCCLVQHYRLRSQSSHARDCIIQS